jgi:hypothetical protein
MTGVSCRNIYEAIDKEYIEAEIRYLSHDSEDGAGFILQVDPTLTLQNYTSQVPKLQFEYAELVQTITFAAGLIQIFMAILRVEFLVSAIDVSKRWFVKCQF